MKPVRTFTVVPRLPVRLSRLRELAYNVWWTWDRDAMELFQRLDRDLWEESEHNPVRMLGSINQGDLEARARDDGYLAHYDRVCERFDRYRHDPLWFGREHGVADSPRIAYFSAEFGLTECLPIYSGGLGILAGDHLKAASDLGMPLVGVGLLYQQGYFRQYLNRDGWQGESYPVNDFYTMPVELVTGSDKTGLFVEVPLPGRQIRAKIWRVNVGRVPLILLDTNCRENLPVDKKITGELYGGDQEMRIQQEIVLGIGGVRALAAVGFKPAAFHMNEGHSAFLALERTRVAMESCGLSFAEAAEAIRASSIFTTHTPVPAGIDVFPPQLMEKYFRELATQMGLSWTDFLHLGAQADGNPSGGFSMANLAFRFSSFANGVSKLHGKVSRNMWKDLWPGVPENEVPISSVTNGVHMRSWVSKDMGTLYERYLGQGWTDRPENQEMWRRAPHIPAEELWRTHERRRERLVAFARDRLRSQMIHRGSTARELDAAGNVLDPEALTIGFARRFATYKRADLLLRDPDRLASILNHPERPVQIIFSGKAHPKDNPGKELIRELLHIAREERFRRRIVFLENYDMVISRYLVQGVDVWLNTPRRLYEASGTSGMKAAANGVLNLSILDGWWDEAFQPELGWAIGKGEEYEDIEYQYDVESSAIYDLLEQEVVPLFYDRGRDRIPRGWVGMMQQTLKDLCPVFNTARMVAEYTSAFYVPAMNRQARFTADGCQLARDLTNWRQRVDSQWPSLAITDVGTDLDDNIHVGDSRTVTVTVQPGGLTADEIDVQVYEGRIDREGKIAAGRTVSLQPAPAGPGDASGSRRIVYEGPVSCSSSGRHGFGIRVVPKHTDLPNPFDTKLIRWYEG